MGSNSDKNSKARHDNPQPVRPVRILSHLSASLIAIVFGFGILQFELDGLKGLLFDLSMRLGGSADRTHPAIALIAYDQESAEKYFQTDKIAAEAIAETFEKLKLASPKGIGLLATVNNTVYSDYELELIADSSTDLKNAVIGYTDSKSFSNPEISPPLPGIPYRPGIVSRDTFSYGADSVTRRVMISIGAVPTLYGELARLSLEQSQLPHFKHSHHYGKTGPLQAYIDWRGRSDNYPMVSIAQLAQGNADPNTFNGKIVLIGSTLSKDPSNFVKTPYTRKDNQTLALQAAAHGLATLLEDSALAKSPPWFDLVLSLLVGVITVNLILFLSPVRGILFVFAELALLFSIAWVSLVFANFWIDLAHPFVIACFGYYLVIPYRLVNEYRRRWHYQQKSELMAQLEQLKTNFLNLVSHDLKTPIARIQGNAELIQNSIVSGRLQTDPRTAKSLQGIINTTENLSEYVETILDLTRIESARIPLDKSSRDINAVITEVVNSKKLHASEKAISIETELEPIFSFKFDSKLIRRVIANLVENAIKYSPDRSHICISTAEENNWIRVSVRDNGCGIPKDEQGRIFTKFYRVENEKTRAEKGTGLGLYLVKYFTELHNGIISLESEVGKGSTFVISLPA